MGLVQDLLDQNFSGGLDSAEALTTSTFGMSKMFTVLIGKCSIVWLL